MGTFDAFGVRFASSFSIPEVRSDDGEDAGPPPAACVLALVATEEPSRRFSGPCDPPKVALTSVGRTERGHGGDLLLSHGTAASFWISAPADEVACGPAAGTVDDPGWRRYLFDSVLGSVALVRGFEALHAGAVLAGSGVVAVAAGEGGGKSSLVAALLARGLPLFTDDLLMLADGLAHPGPALMNLPPGGRTDAVGRRLAEVDGEAWVAVDRPPVGPAPVAAVVLLERGRADAVTVDRLHANPLTLLPLSLQGGSTPERQRSRFDACAAVAGTAVVLRLAAPLAATPDELADAVLAATGS